jgi:hypothetical protein
MLGLSNGIEYTGEDISDITPPSSYSMSFDGVGDFLAITQKVIPIELDGENFSISFWCKRDADDGDASCILGMNNTASWSRLHFNADGDRLTIESDQDGEHAYGAVTADTNWHHYVITHLGGGAGSGGIGKVLMYEDGAVVTMCNTSGCGANFGNTQDEDMSFDRIGSDSGGGTTELKGLLYQLVIFNVVLTAGTVAAIYNGGTPISLDNMAGISHFWKFSENTGSTTADSVGGVTATLTGDAAFSSTTP